ncbi:MAG: tetratricopeptide repeat protein, partial [Verrucomicrobiaceae bacterium]
MEVALAALARSDALGLLPDEVSGHRIRLEAVLQWFRREENAGRWLLILDGVENTANWLRVKALLEKVGEGTILVTSRIRQWEEARAIAVGPWGPETAHEYLVERVMPGKAPSRNNLLAADRLAEGVHRLPLALEILAAYLIDLKETPAEFAATLGDSSRGGGAGAAPALGFQDLVARVLTQLDAFTRGLLLQIVSLAPEPAAIPLAVFEQRGDWAQIRVSLNRLQSLALTGTDEMGRTISIHRTISETIRGLVSAEEQSAALGAALSNVDAALRRTQGGAPLREALVPHCRSLLEQLHGHAMESHAASLVQSYARWLQDNGRAAEADPYFRWALHLDEQRLGGIHPEVVQRLRDLVSVLRIRGQLHEAISFARLALEMTGKLSGPQHPDVVGDLYNLAGCLRAVNEFGEAEALCRQALQIEERQTNPNHPRAAVALHRLAGLLEAAGRLSEADGLYRRALAIDESAFAITIVDRTISEDNQL